MDTRFTAYAEVRSCSITSYPASLKFRFMDRGAHYDERYTWDARGNLVSDGTFTYTYNAAGRMVQVESITATLVYTYTSAGLSAGNAAGLRVAQSVDGDVTNFAWDWATGVPEMLSDGEDLYLVSYQTPGQ